MSSGGQAVGIHADELLYGQVACVSFTQAAIWTPTEAFARPCMLPPVRHGLQHGLAEVAAGDFAVVVALQRRRIQPVVVLRNHLLRQLRRVPVEVRPLRRRRDGMRARPGAVLTGSIFWVSAAIQHVWGRAGYNLLDMSARTSEGASAPRKVPDLSCAVLSLRPRTEADARVSEVRPRRGLTSCFQRRTPVLPSNA